LKQKKRQYKKRKDLKDQIVCVHLTFHILTGIGFEEEEEQLKRRRIESKNEIPEFNPLDKDDTDSSDKEDDDR
jgi:hypothetical protein